MITVGVLDHAGLRAHCDLANPDAEDGTDTPLVEQDLLKSAAKVPRAELAKQVLDFVGILRTEQD